MWTMSRQSKRLELRNLYNSFSYDAPLTMYSRAGDEGGAVNTRLDLLASTQSAEAEIIEAEERAERQGTQRRFMQLLGLYLKKILAPVEFKFFALSVRTAETPYAIGRDLGLNYETAIETITAKYAANFLKLLRLLRAYGYGGAVQGFEFMPQWRRYVEAQKKNRENVKAVRRRILADPERRAAFNEKKRKYRAANRDSINARTRERYREYYQDPEHRAAKRAYNREAYRRRLADPEKRAAYNVKARQGAREWRERNREAVNEKQRIWRAAHAEHVRELRRLHYQNHREEIRAKVNARRAAQRAADPEAYRAKRREEKRKYREKHREAINEKQRQRYAARRDQLREYHCEYYHKYRKKQGGQV